MKAPHCCFLSAVALATLLAPPLYAASLVNVGDGWQRQVDPDNSGFDGDLLAVWSQAKGSGGEAGFARSSVVQFDLSTLTSPITDVALGLWSRSNGFSDDANPIKQYGVLLDASILGNAAGTADALSWSNVQGALGATLTELGSYDLPSVANDPTRDGKYLFSGGAADAAAVEAIRISANPTLYIGLFAYEDGEVYGESWGDGEYGGEDAILLTNADAVAALNPPPPPASEVVVPLQEAAWVRAGDPSRTYLNDGAIVSNNASVIGGVPAYGFMQWDLSGVSRDPAQLVGVELSLFTADAGRTQAPGQSAGLIDTTGGTPIEAMTHATFVAEYLGQETALEGLGVVPLGTPAQSVGQELITIATSADVELVRSLLGGGGLLTLAFQGADATSGQYWGDGSYGRAPLLTLTFVPEPATTLSLCVSLALGLAWRHRGKP